MDTVKCKKEVANFEFATPSDGLDSKEYEFPHYMESMDSMTICSINSINYGYNGLKRTLFIDRL